MRKSEKSVILLNPVVREENFVNSNNGGCETAFFKVLRIIKFQQNYFEFRENDIIDFRESPTKNFTKIDLFWLQSCKTCFKCNFRRNKYLLDPKKILLFGSMSDEGWMDRGELGGMRDEVLGMRG